MKALALTMATVNVGRGLYHVFHAGRRRGALCNGKLVVGWGEAPCDRSALVGPPSDNDCRTCYRRARKLLRRRA